jgi:hypothetical protein
MSCGLAIARRNARQADKTSPQLLGIHAMRFFWMWLFVVVAAPAWGSPQADEWFMVDGAVKYSRARPLEQAMAADPALRDRVNQHIKLRCLRLVRGYIGHWEIKNGKLYLVKLESADCKTMHEIPLAAIFPNQQAPILASWFSSTMDFYEEGNPRCAKLGCASEQRRFELGQQVP